MTDQQPEPDDAYARIDQTKPHIARVYDAWLGGKDNYAVDRVAAEKVAKVLPNFRESVLANRAFLARAVHFLAEDAGIRQFLDIGTGLPTANNTHEVAQKAAPAARIVYVDNDPIVLAHARALLTSTSEGATEYIEADVRDPDVILRGAARTLDFDQPVGLMLVAILHCVGGPTDPYGIVEQLSAALPSGSHLVISHPASDIQTREMAAATEALNEDLADPVHPRNHAEVLRFFDGWELLEPGLVSTSQWRSGVGIDPKPQPVWAGVARKP